MVGRRTSSSVSVERIALNPDDYHGMTSGDIAEDLGARLRGVAGLVVVSEPKNGGMEVWCPLLRTALAYTSPQLRIVGNEWFYARAKTIYGVESISGDVQSGYYLRKDSDGGRKSPVILEDVVMS